MRGRVVGRPGPDSDVHSCDALPPLDEDEVGTAAWRDGLLNRGQDAGLAARLGQGLHDGVVAADSRARDVGAGEGVGGMVGGPAAGEAEAKGQRAGRGKQAVAKGLSDLGIAELEGRMAGDGREEGVGGGQGSLHELLSLQTGHGRPEDGESTVVDDFCLNRLCHREEGGARQTSVLRQFQRANSGVNEILGGRAESEGLLASAKEAAAKGRLEEKAASATPARCGSPSPPWASGWCARPAWSGVRSGRPARGARALRTASSHASKSGRATAGGTVRARWLRRGAWQKRRRRTTCCGAFFNASSLACSRSTLVLSATRTGAAWPSGAPRTATASPLLARHNVHLGGCRTRPNGAPSASAKAITSSLGRASSVGGDGDVVTVCVDVEDGETGREGTEERGNGNGEVE